MRDIVVVVVVVASTTVTNASCLISSLRPCVDITELHDCKINNNKVDEHRTASVALIRTHAYTTTKDTTLTLGVNNARKQSYKNIMHIIFFYMIFSIILISILFQHHVNVFGILSCLLVNNVCDVIGMFTF